MNRLNAILLLGPTGAGKTPLGDYLQQHGLHNRRCAHFDFGAQLRAAAVSSPPELSPNDLSIIRHSLQTGALLEDHQFHIAAGILHAFARSMQLTNDDLLILNGLPRHEGQAQRMEDLVAMQAIINLECTPQVVHDRIRLNTGGDRSGRIDDSVDAVARKLALFAARTAPLIEHYRARGIPIRSIPIAVDTTPQQIVQKLSLTPPRD